MVVIVYFMKNKNSHGGHFIDDENKNVNCLVTFKEGFDDSNIPCRVFTIKLKIKNSGEPAIPFDKGEAYQSSKQVAKIVLSLWPVIDSMFDNIKE